MLSMSHHGQHGKTPLHEASGQGHVEVVRLLLQHGADANMKDEVYSDIIDDDALLSSSCYSLDYLGIMSPI